MFSSLNNLSDEELVRRVHQGNERALTVLYERYSKKLVRYFHRMLWKDEEKAQDFLHDLFMKIIEKPERVDSGRKFSTWIYSSAYNMCKNEYRKQSFRNSALHPSLGKVLETLQPEVDHKDFQNVLEIILNCEDEDDRNLFVLKYELDMPLAHIAAVLDCPEGTVKSRLFYLKRKLASYLRVYNPAFN